MYMLCLVTIVIWLTVTVLFTYDFRPAQGYNLDYVQYVSIYMHLNRE
jgi:hypothetical protein